MEHYLVDGDCLLVGECPQRNLADGTDITADDERRLEETPHRKLRPLFDIRQRRLPVLAVSFTGLVCGAAHHKEIR